jgi:hypothetical protein
MGPVYETPDELQAASWSMIRVLCREQPGDMRPLPARGDLVTVSVCGSSDNLFGKGEEPLENGVFVWGEEGPAERLDESSYRERGWDAATASRARASSSTTCGWPTTARSGTCCTPSGGSSGVAR